MARKKKKTELPTEGAAFAVPLEDGRYSVCRVLHDRDSEYAQEQRSRVILVACSAWVGDKVPDVTDESLRPILYLTHHAWKNKAEVVWIDDELPADFIPIGTIEPTPEEKAIESLTFSSWHSVRIQPLAQWRWDHDREAVLAEDQEKARRKEQENTERLRHQREQFLAEATLERLQKRRFFPHWGEYPSKQAIRKSRKIMKETVNQLVELGQKTSKMKRMAVLQACIESFNALDVELDHFIETIEREDICEEFELIQHACGLGEIDDLSDEWREW